MQFSESKTGGKLGQLKIHHAPGKVKMYLETEINTLSIGTVERLSAGARRGKACHPYVVGRNG